MNAPNWVIRNTTLTHLALDHAHLDEQAVRALILGGGKGPTKGGLHQNHTLLGLHITEGNACQMDSKGFLVPGAPDRPFSLPGRETPDIEDESSMQAIGVRQRPLLLSRLVFSQTCYLCHGWTEHTFVYTPGISGPAPGSNTGTDDGGVLLLLHIDRWRPDKMKLLVDGSYRADRMVPCAKPVKYLFQVASDRSHEISVLENASSERDELPGADKARSTGSSCQRAVVYAKEQPYTTCTKAPSYFVNCINLPGHRANPRHLFDAVPSPAMNLGDSKDNLGNKSESKNEIHNRAVDICTGSKTDSRGRKLDQFSSTVFKCQNALPRSTQWFEAPSNADEEATIWQLKTSLTFGPRYLDTDSKSCYVSKDFMNSCFAADWNKIMPPLAITFGFMSNHDPCWRRSSQFSRTTSSSSSTIKAPRPAPAQNYLSSSPRPSSSAVRAKTAAMHTEPEDDKLKIVGADEILHPQIRISSAPTTKSEINRKTENASRRRAIEGAVGLETESAVQMQRLQQLLRHVYPQLCDAFRYYASMGTDDNPSTMSVRALHVFCIDNMMVDNENLRGTDIDRIFISCTLRRGAAATEKGVQRRTQAGSSMRAWRTWGGLTRADFLLAVVRLACHRYIDSSAMTSIRTHAYVDALTQALDDILPTKGYDPQIFRVEKLYHESVDKSFIPFMPSIRHLFEVCTSTRKNGRMYMTSVEWLHLLREFGYIDKTFSLEDAKRCFVDSCMPVIDERATNRHKMLSITDFVEALCRVTQTRRMPDMPANLPTHMDTRPLSNKACILLAHMLSKLRTRLEEEEPFKQNELSSRRFRSVATAVVDHLRLQQESTLNYQLPEPRVLLMSEVTKWRLSFAAVDKELLGHIPMIFLSEVIKDAGLNSLTSDQMEEVTARYDPEGTGIIGFRHSLDLYARLQHLKDTSTTQQIILTQSRNLASGSQTAAMAGTVEQAAAEHDQDTPELI